MKKIKKILAGVLTALSFSGGVKASGKKEFESGITQTNEVSSSSKSIKGKVIGAAIGVATLGATYGLGREGIYNGLFMNSNKNLFHTKYSSDEIEKEEKKLLNEHKGFKRIELKTNLGNLKGFSHFPKNKNVNKIILVCGGNSEISSVSVKYAFERSPKADQENAAFICFDYPTYGRSTGPTLSQKVMQQYAEAVLGYAKELKNCENAEISVYGYSLGGYPASYLSKFKDVKEVNLWSPVQWEGAVQGLTGIRKLGWLGRIWAFGGAEFDSIENIKNSHENCKINLFSGSHAAGDFLSLETTVFKGGKYEGQITDNKYLKENLKNKPFDDKIKNWERAVAREAFKKLAKEGKNNLGERLTVSFLAEAGHCDKDFNDEVWHLESTCKNNVDK